MLERLKARAKTEQINEDKAAARGRAKEIVAAIDAIVDEHLASIEQILDVNRRLNTAVSQLTIQRELDPEVDTLTIEQFHRIGVALSYELPQRKMVEETYGFSRPAQMITPLFGSLTIAKRYGERLIDTPAGVVEDIKKKLNMRETGTGNSHWRPDLSDQNVQRHFNQWRQELLLMLGADELDQAREQITPADSAESVISA